MDTKKTAADQPTMPAPPSTGSSTPQPSQVQSPKKTPVKMTGGDIGEWLLQRESLMLRMKHMEEKLERRKSHQKEVESDVRKLQTLLDGERENNAEICAYYKKQVWKSLLNHKNEIDIISNENKQKKNAGGRKD